METLPDDAIIIIPDWAKSYMRAINKRNKNPELSIKSWFAPDMFKNPDDVRGLMKLLLIPVFFIREENATADFSQRFFNLANGIDRLEPINNKTENK
jgi:hypothetical protein